MTFPKQLKCQGGRRHFIDIRVIERTKTHVVSGQPIYWKYDGRVHVQWKPYETFEIDTVRPGTCCSLIREIVRSDEIRLGTHPGYAPPCFTP